MRTIQIVRAAFTASIIPLASSAGDPVNNRVNGVSHYDKVVPPPGPVQPGALVDKCGGWVQAVRGTTCYDLEKSLGIDLKTFNPQLKGDCSKNLWADYYYCKGFVQSKSIAHPDPKITDPPPPPPLKKPDHDCPGAELDICAAAVFTARETPGPMIDWCKRYLNGPTCTERGPEGIFSSYDKFPRQADASSLCAYPGAPPMAPRFSTACRCFT